MSRLPVVVAVSLLALTLGAVGLVSAQTPAPTLTIDLGTSRITVQGADGMPSGPTRVVFRNTGRGAADAGLAAMRPGRTINDFRRALPTLERGFGQIQRVVSFEAGGAVEPGASYTTTIDLRPNTNYVAARVPSDLRKTVLQQFTVGAQANGAARPTPDATVGVYDYAYGMPETLPRQGTIRFENRGQRVHIAVAFPLRPGASRTAALRALIANDEKRLGRLINERGIREPLGVVSGGTVNDVAFNFPRAGNWVFACFLEDGEPGNPEHNTIGMVKAFRVR